MSKVGANYREEKNRKGKSVLPEELEIWKKPKDPELSRYEVSSRGNVKSLIGKEKLIKLTTEERGYVTVWLSKPPL